MQGLREVEIGCFVNVKSEQNLDGLTKWYRKDVFGIWIDVHKMYTKYSRTMNRLKIRKSLIYLNNAIYSQVNVCVFNLAWS